MRMRLTVVAVRRSCGQAEIWSAGSKHQFTALKAAPGDQTGGRGQTRQGSTTSADGHTHPGNPPRPGAAGPAPPWPLTAPRARQPAPARDGGSAPHNFHAARRPQGTRDWWLIRVLCGEAELEACQGAGALPVPWYAGPECL